MPPLSKYILLLHNINQPSTLSKPSSTTIRTLINDLGGSSIKGHGFQILGKVEIHVKRIYEVRERRERTKRDHIFLKHKGERDTIYL